MRKTKIICTLGPSTDKANILKELMLNGMDVARINMSHQEHWEHLERINMVKKLRQQMSLPIALLLDTKGPEIRIGKFNTPQIHLKKGQIFTLTTDEILGDETIVSVSFKELAKEIVVGTKILIDDGLICLSVQGISGNSMICEVVNGGVLSANKGINIPGLKLSLPFISPKDLDDIKFAVEQDFDFIAASFARTADDIKHLRNKLSNLGGSHIKIIAKIENSEGVNNIDEIINVADGIMVARGDLGVEVPLEDIPKIQKQLIKKTCAAGKLVITATQMLDSMIKNPRPTRAEVNDVANAIYDGTSAIMLSGETAAGAYPIEAVKMMSSIAAKTEADIDYKKRFFNMKLTKRPTITSATSHATCTTALDLEASAIFTLTESGRTAQFVSQYRPSCPIIAGTSDQTVLRQLNLFWGVVPLLIENEVQDLNQLVEKSVQTASTKNLLKNGDLIVITAGLPLGKLYGTNFLKVHFVGNILCSGHGVTNASVSGNVCVCKNEAEAFSKFKPGDILVISETSDNILDIIKDSKAVVTEAHENNSHAAVVGIALDKPVITGAQNATELLQDNAFVTVDAARGIVFEGN